ncbi:nuclear transport factor 2 family protein [uncultured Roseobacter sp.]|uniref:YybH family protein n=1 Tax=uncultured Roseobacter sp. TaxID=114847 RepID=UPI002621876F|nr:nuclear transport factor 2 family protein [uncultured Roseobacter sp.]
MKTLTLLAALSMAPGLALADTLADSAASSLTALNNTFNASAASSDADALVSLYAEDTLWITQGVPVRHGLAGPRELFDFVTENAGKVTHTIDHLFVAEDATLAVMIGSVEAVIETAGMDTTSTYLFVLQPEEDGWKIVTDMWHQHTE